jgi:hypothetical protein
MMRGATMIQAINDTCSHNFVEVAMNNQKKQNHEVKHREEIIGTFTAQAKK